MAVLWFIGMGLGDEKDLSQRGLGVLRRCERVYAEEYTSILRASSFDRLSQSLGKPVELLDRAAVEGEHVILDALRATENVGFVVAGDPFAATTHISLRLAVERAGHSWRYLPNASILTAAAGYLGLQPYRFGPVTSLPLPKPNFAPTSPVDRIAKNQELGFHTLVLLDLEPTEGRFMDAAEALRLLADRDPGGDAIPLEQRLCVVARVGRDDERAWYGRRETLLRIDFGPPLHALVIPAGELHAEEAAALARFRAD